MKIHQIILPTSIFCLLEKQCILFKHQASDIKIPLTYIAVMRFGPSKPQFPHLQNEYNKIYLIKMLGN